MLRGGGGESEEVMLGDSMYPGLPGNRQGRLRYVCGRVPLCWGGADGGVGFDGESVLGWGG